MPKIGWLFLVLPLFVAFVSGCSRNPSAPCSVNGKITYKGEVVPAGSITFHVEKGGIFTYSINNGTYSGKDLPASEMVVTIETESANPKGASAKGYGASQGQKGGSPDDYAAKMREMGRIPEGAAPANAGGYVKIPEKYASKDKSPLKVTLTKGNNENNFELTD